MITLAHIHGPHIDWVGLSPFIALAAGGLVVLLVGLLSPSWVRERVVPVLTIATLAAALVFEIRSFKHQASIISGANRGAAADPMRFALATDRRIGRGAGPERTQT